MNYYESLEKVILTTNPKEKIELFEKFYKNFKEKKLYFENTYKPYELIKPSYNDILKIVLPKEVKQTKYVNTKEGKKILLHTIAHIEYSAIDMALDAALRFKNMPISYYEDWLEVAEDEIRHFLMLEKLLIELDSFFGDLEVHTNLFEALKKTPDILSRMAIVPRYLEANGLEQNPKIMEKLKSNPDEFNEKIINALEIILEEEVEHVSKGDKWFKYLCEKENFNVEKKYFEILENIYPGSTSKKYDLNIEARKKAGFSCDELKFLSKKEDCN
ncbi:ferritin-like domain-containing protein [Arcobacter arenosus]|uniref:Ferritin-like domain-containing protein n=1 Tax=Arcobacter arenosus TaxID=2576037 RepID=A0A5R8XXQ5_9BACT|nr:ferritin-like domain-containing protein [Arcobacter arenosus]TLP35761.1 ferritin-like domain-containing protein [Arcobacter arenosus]